MGISYEIRSVCSRVTRTDVSAHNIVCERKSVPAFASFAVYFRGNFIAGRKCFPPTIQGREKNLVHFC